MLNRSQLREQDLCLWLLVSLGHVSGPFLRASPAPEGLAGQGGGRRSPAGSGLSRPVLFLLLPQRSPAGEQGPALKGREQFKEK